MRWLRGLPWVLIGTGIAVNIGFLRTLWASFAYGLVLGASMFFGVSRLVSFLYACFVPAVLFCVYFTAKNAPGAGSVVLYLYVWAKAMAPALILAPLVGWLAAASAHRFWARRPR
jgi:hypothetical protein